MGKSYMASHTLFFDICRICLVGPHPIDRDQWYSQVAHLFQQAMQGGLVSHRTGEKRIAVLFQCQPHASKPVFPFKAEMTFEPDLIDHDWTRMCLRFNAVGHCLYL